MEYIILGIMVIVAIILFRVKKNSVSTAGKKGGGTSIGNENKLDSEKPHNTK